MYIYLYIYIYIYIYTWHLIRSQQVNFVHVTSKFISSHPLICISCRAQNWGSIRGVRSCSLYLFDSLDGHWNLVINYSSRQHLVWHCVCFHRGHYRVASMCRRLFCKVCRSCTVKASGRHPEECVASVLTRDFIHTWLHPRVTSSSLCTLHLDRKGKDSRWYFKISLFRLSGVVFAVIFNLNRLTMWLEVRACTEWVMSLGQKTCTERWRGWRHHLQKSRDSTPKDKGTK